MKFSSPWNLFSVHIVDLSFHSQYNIQLTAFVIIIVLSVFFLNVYLLLQALEAPFLRSIEATLGERYTEQMETIYRQIASFLVQVKIIRQ